jgi:NitT/TauT family transport system permease protein
MATTAALVGEPGPSILARLRGRLPETVGTPLLVVAIIALWQLAIVAFDIRAVILPSPLAVWNSLIVGLNPASPQAFYPHIGITLWEILAGFGLGALIGLVLALLLSQLRMLERVVKPLIVAFQSMPKIAIAPMFIIWFGFGAASKIALVALVVFFPILVAGLTGFRSVDQERLEVMRSLGSSKWQTFTKLVLPGSLPFVFAGLEISLVHAMTATIVAEFLAGAQGLGVLVVQMGQVLNTAGVFAVMVVLGLLGWGLVQILALVRKRLLFWSIDTRRPNI